MAGGFFTVVFGFRAFLRLHHFLLRFKGERAMRDPINRLLCRGINVRAPVWIDVIALSVGIIPMATSVQSL
jgi:hypothetical protein